MSLNLNIYRNLQNQIKPYSNTKLLVVTKKRDVKNIRYLMKLGQTLFGENKVQEAELKFDELRKYFDFELHFIGPLQSNKVKKALQTFDVIQSIDRFKIVDEILRHKDSNSRTKEFYIQVNIGSEQQKSGVPPEKLNDLYEYCNNNCLIIKGIMCIPPASHDPNIFFQEMLNLRNKINKNLLLSMGMSDDYEIALKYETNLIRIGSLLFQN